MLLMQRLCCLATTSRVAYKGVAADCVLGRKRARLTGDCNCARKGLVGHRDADTAPSEAWRVQFGKQECENLEWVSEEVTRARVQEATAGWWKAAAW